MLLTKLFLRTSFYTNCRRETEVTTTVMREEWYDQQASKSSPLPRSSFSFSFLISSLSLSLQMWLLFLLPLSLLLLFYHVLKVAFLSFFILLSFLGWHFYLPFSSLSIFKWQKFSLFLSFFSWCNASYFSLLLSETEPLLVASYGQWKELISFLDFFIKEYLSFVSASLVATYLLLGFPSNSFL